MHCMVASSIPCKLSLCADRAHARAGDSHVSSAIDVACPTTQSVFAIASPHELHGDSWPSSSTGTRSFCCNQQYSITAVTTSTGTIAERYAYSAYGQPTILDASGSILSSSAISNRYTYTGREWDATLGLYHFRARWMSPSAGRFLGRDPIGYEGSEWSLHEFGNSSPVQELDPSGLVAIVCECNCKYRSDGPRAPSSHKRYVTTNCTGGSARCCDTACASLHSCWDVPRTYQGDFRGCPRYSDPYRECVYCVYSGQFRMPGQPFPDPEKEPWDCSKKAWDADCLLGYEICSKVTCNACWAIGFPGTPVNGAGAVACMMTCQAGCLWARESCLKRGKNCKWE